MKQLDLPSIAIECVCWPVSERNGSDARLPFLIRLLPLQLSPAQHTKKGEDYNRLERPLQILRRTVSDRLCRVSPNKEKSW